MAIYLATLEMRAIGHDYRRFFESMRESGAYQALETGWLIETQEPLRSLSDRLLTLLAPVDGLFLLEVTANLPWAATRLKQGTGEWLKRHRP